MNPKRYALVGAGKRAAMFLDAIAGPYRDHSELVALCDISPTRMQWHNQRRQEKFGLPPVPAYAAAEFARLLREQRPDAVIVCSMDATHHQYIIPALEHGADVITEKPMTIDAPKARAILDAVQRTGRLLRVTFNYRYAPLVTKVRELMTQGIVGTPLAVDMQWLLDTSHGADYFRRWHRHKENTGGLLVHKSTHHFDLINWWLRSWPQTVFAMGGLKFYGRDNATARGESYSYERYTGQAAAADDPFALDLARAGAGTLGAPADSAWKGLYLDAEAETGYIRDRNVFDAGITIEDTLSVLVRYRNGVQLTYSLLAYTPWEGYRVAITGTKGRLEVYDKHGAHILPPNADAARHEQTIRVFPMFGVPYDVPVPPATGEHGGGDALLLEQLFAVCPPPDPWHRAASHLDGAASILVGMSGNESLRTGLPVQCDDVLPLPTPR